MQPFESLLQPAQASAKSIAQNQRRPLPDRVAYTPKEFAASFGRSETWGYRQLYSGRVKAMQISGRLLIPKSEIDRLLAEAAIYNGVPERAPKAKRASAQASRNAKLGTSK